MVVKKGGQKPKKMERFGDGARGYNIEIKDERRQEEGKEDRGRGNNIAGKTQTKRKGLCVTCEVRGRKGEVGKEKEEDSNNNSLVLSLYSDKFPSGWGVSALAEPDPMTNHLHPALKPWLFMIRQLIRAGKGASWVSSWVGLLVTPGTL